LLVFNKVKISIITIVSTIKQFVDEQQIFEHNQPELKERIIYAAGTSYPIDYETPVDKLFVSGFMRVLLDNVASV